MNNNDAMQNLEKAKERVLNAMYTEEQLEGTAFNLQKEIEQAVEEMEDVEELYLLIDSLELWSNEFEDAGYFFWRVSMITEPQLLPLFDRIIKVSREILDEQAE